MADIRINDLPNEATPNSSDFLAIDGVSTRKSTIQLVVNAGAPVASQSQAEAGTDNNARMTALSTKQAIDFNSVPLSRTLTAGTGLAGGGSLSANISLALSSTSISSLAKADSSVQSVNGVTPVSGNVTIPAANIYGVVDINQYGYVNGATSGFSSAANAAISYLSSIGGGILRIPTGIHILDDTVTIRSKVYICGNGSGSTIVKAKNSLNKNMFETFNSSSLFGTNTNSGEAYWGIQGITIHGNKDNNSSGHSIYTYSRTYLLSDLRIFFASGCGIKSEWYTGAVDWGQAGLENTDKSMETQLINVHVSYSRQDGIDWNGPHDSQWSNMVVAQSSHDTPGAYDGIKISSASGGLQASNVHSWGDLQRYAFNLGCSYLHFSNCEADDARSALVNWQGDNIVWVGGVSFGAVFNTPPLPHDLTLKGFILGSAGRAIYNPRIDCTVLNCPAGSVDFSNVIGWSGSVRVSGRLTDSNIIPGSFGWVGTPPASGVEIDINVHNSASAPTLVRRAGVMSVGAGSDSFPNYTINSNSGCGINVSASEIGFSLSGTRRAAFGPNYMRIPVVNSVNDITIPWVEGLVVYELSSHKLRSFDGSVWQNCW